jgi:hypothetical protein
MKGAEVNRKEPDEAVDIGMTMNDGYFRTWDGKEGNFYSIRTRKFIQLLEINMDYL